MEALRNVFASRARVKIAVLTFTCILIAFTLINTWHDDMWSTVHDVALDNISSSHEGSENRLDEISPDHSTQSEVPEVDTAQSDSSALSEEPEHLEESEQDSNEDAEHFEQVDENQAEVSDAPATEPGSSFEWEMLTAPETTDEAEERLQPAIVAAAMLPSDVAWMDDFAENYQLFPYIVTELNPPAHLALPANKGREAMPYLSYLIDNYDNLPPYAIFIHGHRTAWHQKVDVESMIRDLKADALEEAGYVSFRWDWIPSCPAELRPKHHDAIVWGDGQHLRETEVAIAEAWPVLFPDIELPDTIASQCCAQFAVTRAAMQRRSKEDYERIRAWLLHTPLEDLVSGRVLEKLWAFMMTDEPVHCPAPQKAACKYFGSCGYHRFERPPKELGPLPVDDEGDEKTSTEQINSPASVDDESDEKTPGGA